MSNDPYRPPAAPPPLPAPGSGRLGDDAGVRLLIPVGRSLWAVAAGYLGLFAFLILPAPVSLLVSLIAIRKIQESRQTAKPLYGMGRAVFGLVMGVIGCLALLFAIYFYFVARRRF